MPIYDLAPDEQGKANSAYQLPDQSVPERERTPDWYANNIRYIGTFYNRWPRNAFVLEQPNDPNRNTTSPGNVSAPAELPVQYMLRMMMYYLGRQPNLDYAHLTPNTSSTNLMPDWIRGQKIYTIITFMKDVMMQMMQNIDFDVKAMSEDAVNDRKLLLDKLMVQFEMREAFEEFKKLGVEINAAPGQEFELPEDAQYYVQEGYKDMDSEIATNIARHVWLFNNCMSKFLQAFVHINTAGQCGVEHYINNGNYFMQLYEPHQLIVDSRWNDDYNRQARFVGTIFYKTPEELFQMYPDFTHTQRQTIQRMAQDSTLTGDYNTMQNLTWWNYGANQLTGTVAVVKGYWYSLRDTGKKKVENEYGVKKIKSVEPDPDGNLERGDYVLEHIESAALIGNKYLIDPGPVNNVAEDYYNKAKLRLPIMVFKPNMVLGESRSVASRLHELQDERDAYKFKIREMVGSSIGKAYVFKGWKFGNGMNQKELYQDLKAMRIHVATHSGEDDVRDESNTSVEIIDMTMDPNVLKLMDIIAAIDNEMMEIAKVSYTSMGEPAKYMGLGVMQNAMQNSSGSQYVYSSFMDYIQMNMQYAVDVLKYLYTEDDTDYPSMIIGKRGVEYLKVAKSVRYSNPLVYLTINDFIDNKTKERLLDDAHAAIQTGDLKFLDLVHVQTAKTYTELKDKLIYSLKKNDKQKERDASMQMMMQQLMEQNKNLTMQIQEMIRQQGALSAAQTKVEGQMAGQALGNAYQMMQPPQQSTPAVSNS